MNNEIRTAYKYKSVYVLIFRPSMEFSGSKLMVEN